MSVSTSPMTSIAHTAPRRRGPVPNDEAETRTPAGRALRSLECVAFNGSTEALGYREDRDLRQLHDAQADRHVEAIAVLGESMLLSGLSDEAVEKVHAILRHVQGYQQADEHEDAAAERGDVRVSRMHQGFKSIAGWCERSLVAIRNQTRGSVAR